MRKKRSSTVCLCVGFVSIRMILILPCMGLYHTSELFSPCKTGKLQFDPDIQKNKLKLSGYDEQVLLTTVPVGPT